ncbi:MAG: LamB/YcsF family protein [Chloroflexota bacterium]|nr:LamB/YcsF family protein [Chloroflexota bacterium]MDQ5864182.1 LamB/YcsF family protein [Chloroflexota bacterium]
MPNETRTIDLNADVGESFGAWPMGHDREIMPFITSANVACGGHAGDPNVMAATVRLAASHGVSVGAHPGYPDLAGFGRRAMAFSPEEVRHFVLYQVGALWAIGRACGIELRHVKPHGALYNMAARDRATAEAIAGAVRDFSRELPLMCLAGSLAEEVSRDIGLPTLAEGFADRAYEPGGVLRDRKLPGSVHHDAATVAEQVVGLAGGELRTVDGSTLRVQVDTICLHSDTPAAALFAQVARQALEEAGFRVAAPKYS